jgi:hypothetical protein
MESPREAKSPDCAGILPACLSEVPTKMTTWYIPKSGLYDYGKELARSRP